MNGYRFTHEDYLYPDCKTRGDVFVWSITRPSNNRYQLVTLPDWIADIFRRCSKAHTVITSLENIFITMNERVA